MILHILQPACSITCSVYLLYYALIAFIEDRGTLKIEKRKCQDRKKSKDKLQQIRKRMNDI